MECNNTFHRMYLFLVGQIFACDSRRPHFNALARGDPLWISRRSLPLQKLEWFFYLMVKPHGRSFILLDTILACDGRSYGSLLVNFRSLGVIPRRSLRPTVSWMQCASRFCAGPRPVHRLHRGRHRAVRQTQPRLSSVCWRPVASQNIWGPLDILILGGPSLWALPH